MLMPVFNEERYVADAIASILDFTYQENLTVRVIVVDDISTDGTPSILQTLCEKWGDRLVFMQNLVKGKNNAFNMAFAYSDADYVCLMGGDDLIVPDVLALRVMALDDAIRNGASENLVFASFCKIKTFSDIKKYDGVVIPRDSSKGSLSGGSLMLPYEFASNVFPLPSFLPNEDTWIGLCIRYLGVIQVHVPKIGLLYRIHSGNSHQRGVEFSKFREMMWVRSRAYIFFYAKYMNKINHEIDFLREMTVELGKYVGLGFGVFFLRGLKLKDAVKSLTYSTRIGYLLKQKLFSYLTGR